MHYQGGKHVEGPHFARFLTGLQEDRPYWEPFCGSCGVMRHMKGERFGSDFLPDIVMMWQAMQNGWVPPSVMPREEWLELKHAEQPSALRAFAGFGCSFRGCFFGGYAKNAKSAITSSKSAIRKAADLTDVTFFCADYKKVNVQDDTLIYCDPPYEGTSGYKGTASSNFSHEVFWRWVRRQSSQHIVIVSSFEGPADFDVVFEYETLTTLSGTPIPVTERLFRYKGK